MPALDEEPTLDEVKTTVEDLTKQLAEQNALLKKLEDEAAAEAKARDEQKAQDQHADDLEAQGQELLKQAAALRGKGKK